MFLRGFLDHTGDTSSSNVGVVKVDKVVMVDTSTEKVTESDLPRKTEYDKVNTNVTWMFSRYRLIDSLECLVASVSMPNSGAGEGIIWVEKCLTMDNICHGREGHMSDFFYMYACLLKDCHVRVPFNEFTMGVLRILK